MTCTPDVCNGSKAEFDEWRRWPDIALMARDGQFRRMYSVSYEATPEDLVAAYRLNYLTTLKSRRVFRAYVVGAAILGVALAAAAWKWNFISAPLGAALGAAYWIAFLSLVFLAAYLRLPGQVRRIFDQQKSLHGSSTVEWSQDGITFTSSRNRSQLAWSDFILIVRGTDAIILRQSDAVMNFVPIRILSEAQADSLVRRGATVS
jgi:hypothetical protein